MALETQPRSTVDGIAMPAAELLTKRDAPRSRLVTFIAIAAIVVGIGSMLGGAAGIVFTAQQAAVERIVTPDDAMIADAPVRGPLTMWAQSEVITRHQLDRTDGLRYAEMDRLVPQLDENGQVVLGEDGAPVLVPNQARLSWIDATSLTTVLNLGIMAYALGAFAIVLGAVVAGLGYVVLKLRVALVLLA